MHLCEKKALAFDEFYRMIRSGKMQTDRASMRRLAAYICDGYNYADCGCDRCALVAVMDQL